MGWHIAMWLFLAITACILLVLFLPVGIRVRYQQEELKLWYTFGLIRVPGSGKGRKTKEKGKGNRISIRTVLNEPIKANRKYSGILGDFMAELKTALGLFWQLQPRLRIKRLDMTLRLGGQNPASVALQYGSAWAALSALVPLLEEAFVLKKRRLDVECCFSGGKTTLDAEIDISIGLGRLLWCLVRYSLFTIETNDTIHTERRS